MAKPLVSINMLTYNQEEFITEAIEGVLMQKTNFPFKLVIGEDCSTDGTREIVYEYFKNYPNQIKVITSENNVGSRENELRTLQGCTGKYIAFCEGDDYWTDLHKLQKQIDFLEKNPDYGLVHGDVDHLKNKTGEVTEAFNRTNNIKIPNGDIFKFLMYPSHSIKTMTVCIRKELFQKYYLSNKEIMQSNWALTDISIWLMIAYHSKIHYFDEVFATYRLLPESNSRTKDSKKIHQFHEKIYEIFFYYADKYCDSENIKKDIEILYNKMIMNDAYILRDKEMAKEAIIQLKILNYNFSYKEKVNYFINQFLKNII